MVSGNTESFNYSGNDGTCDHSWLTMLLGNAPLVARCFLHEAERNTGLSLLQTTAPVLMPCFSTSGDTMLLTVFFKL